MELAFPSIATALARLFSANYRPLTTELLLGAITTLALSQSSEQSNKVFRRHVLSTHPGVMSNCRQCLFYLFSFPILKFQVVCNSFPPHAERLIKQLAKSLFFFRWQGPFQPWPHSEAYEGRQAFWWGREACPGGNCSLMLGTCVRMKPALCKKSGMREV